MRLGRGRLPLLSSLRRADGRSLGHGITHGGLAEHVGCSTHCRSVVSSALGRQPWRGEQAEGRRGFAGGEDGRRRWFHDIRCVIFGGGG